MRRSDQDGWQFVRKVGVEKHQPLRRNGRYRPRRDQERALASARKQERTREV